MRISTDLFQQYFNMSVSVAAELMYLEKMEQELSDRMRAQVKKGDTAARDRRRRKEEGNSD